MYKEAGVPLTTVHLGGDEVPRGVWMGSPECRKLMKEKGMEKPMICRSISLHGWRASCKERLEGQRLARSCLGTYGRSSPAVETTD